MNIYSTSQTLNQLINTLKASPQIESEDFAQLMSETFNGLNCPVKYEHDFAMRRHSVWVPNCPQIADDITWTNAAEAAQELTWFLKKYKDYEHTIDYLLNQAKGFINQKPLTEEEFISTLYEIVEHIPVQVLQYDYDDETGIHRIHLPLTGYQYSFSWNRIKFAIACLNAMIDYLCDHSKTQNENLAIFMIRNHPDRLSECKGTLRLTANHEIKIGKHAYDCTHRQPIESLDVLIKYLGYPNGLAEKALLGDADAVKIFNCLNESKCLPLFPLETLSGQHESFSTAAAETDIRWIPDEVKQKLGISKVLTHGMLTFKTPQYVETINLQHINTQRERYTLNSSSYLGFRPDPNTAIKELYITSSVADTIRLIVFFFNINELTGKVFVSIGSNSRIDAALAAINSMYEQAPTAKVYCWLRNKDSISAINEIQMAYPDIDIIGRIRAQPDHFDYDPKMLLQVVPEPYKAMYLKNKKNGI